MRYELDELLEATRELIKVAAWDSSHVDGNVFADAMVRAELAVAAVQLLAKGNGYRH